MTASQEEFEARARAFIVDFCGIEVPGLTAETPLDEIDELDSLFVVSFLQFIENERGAPRPVSAEDGIPTEALRSVRSAYTMLVTAPR
jgi:acyl carrier protein